MTKEDKEYLERDFERTYSKKIKRMEKKAYFQKRRRELGLRKMQTSKKLAYGIMGFTFLNALIIEGYSMWVMYALGDSSALSTLITTGIGSAFAISIEYAIYSLKAFKENSQTERIEFEREKLGASLPLSSDSEEGVG